MGAMKITDTKGGRSHLSKLSEFEIRFKNLLEQLCRQLIDDIMPEAIFLALNVRHKGIINFAMVNTDDIVRTATIMAPLETRLAATSPLLASTEPSSWRDLPTKNFSPVSRW
ncbi:MAG: hypothetical protein ACYCP0_00680 [Acidiferrobacteraceae bacterium]